MGLAALRSAWLAVGGACATLDEASLDAAQRASAAAWEDNPRCNTAVSQDATEGGLGLCMSEPAASFVARAELKQRLVEDKVAVAWSDFHSKAKPGSLRPPPYTFVQQDLGAAEVAEQIQADCAPLSEMRLPEVTWDGEASAGIALSSLIQDAVVLVRGAVPASERNWLDDARRYLLQKAAQPSAEFTEYVHLSKHRHHLRLHASEHPLVERLWRTLAQRTGSVLLPVVSQLGAVVEFAAFITNPGAAGQKLHSDSGNTFSPQQAPLYSAFLFLSDLDDASMGPLQVVPRTHAISTKRDQIRWAVQALAKAGADARCLDHWKLLPIRAGDMGMYDSSALHRGTANTGNRPRVVVYMSMLGVGELPFGSTFAIDTRLLDSPQRLENLLSSVNASPSGGSLRTSEL
ncbi:unnamed protein product [Prorocentrum cordatum]|uniref:Bifunctional lysine-specific demethylase and histidyl-hydroxylase n=1 Tax=Prorocentrum cordatum TaxID=2364126 RepID=A0ABN9TLU6_9DINO|nr:unnamed protein product [Polarella glacialis]